jgi:hypothetical protein
MNCMRHLSDDTLHQLLDDSLDEKAERELELHVHECAPCATRLKEWETLFPHIRGVVPVAEHAGPESEEEFEFRPPQNVVILPDWTPPPSPPRLTPPRPRIAWAAVFVMAVIVGWLLMRPRGQPEEARIVANDENPVAAGPPAPVTVVRTDTAGSGLGVGIADSSKLGTADSAVVQIPLPAAESASRFIPRETAATRPPRDTTPPRQVASAEPTAEIDTENRPAVARRDPPVEFPIKAPVRKTTDDQPSAGSAPAEEPPARPLPATFTRVTLGEAISRLGGPVRLISGMTPEAVEIAAGSALPGADPGRAVIRVIYNAPAGRIILDQQRLNRRGSQEPDIAISTAPSGVSVAQWVDWKGYWISIASHTSQEALLAIANSIAETP